VAQWPSLGSSRWGFEPTHRATSKPSDKAEGISNPFLKKKVRAQTKIVSLEKNAAAPYYTGDMEDGRDKDGPSEV
jgi:hypothetical protein